MSPTFVTLGRAKRNAPKTTSPVRASRPKRYRLRTDFHSSLSPVRRASSPPIYSHTHKDTGKVRLLQAMQDKVTLCNDDGCGGNDDDNASG